MLWREGVNSISWLGPKHNSSFHEARISQKVRGGRWAVSKPAIISNRKYRSWQTNNFNQGGVNLYLTMIEYYTRRNGFRPLSFINNLLCLHRTE